jgi:hypothetical protein
VALQRQGGPPEVGGWASHNSRRTCSGLASQGELRVLQSGAVTYNAIVLISGLRAAQEAQSHILRQEAAAAAFPYVGRAICYHRRCSTQHQQELQQTLNSSM